MRQAYDYWQDQPGSTSSTTHHTGLAHPPPPPPPPPGEGGGGMRQGAEHRPKQGQPTGTREITWHGRAGCSPLHCHMLTYLPHPRALAEITECTIRTIGRRRTIVRASNGARLHSRSNRLTTKRVSREKLGCMIKLFQRDKTRQIAQAKLERDK